MNDLLDIALIQTDISWEDPATNLDNYTSLITGLTQKVDLVVLPEMFGTGFSMNTDLAETMTGNTVTWMQHMSTKYDIGLIGSLIIRMGDDVVNRLIYCDKSGQLQHYDKRHLFRMANEDAYFTAGNEKLVISVNGFNIMPLVCYDLRFPVWSRNHFEDDKYQYDCLIYVANWPAVRRDVWKTLLKARAMENIAYTIGVNRVGKDGNGISYIGNTAAIDPFGKTLAEATDNKEAVVYVSISKRELIEKRKKFPVGMDADRFTLQ